MQELEVLRSRSPEMANFLEGWKNKYENKTFELKDEKQAADFYEGMQEMTRCILGSSQSVSLTAITNIDGLSTLYVHATPIKPKSA